MWETLTGVMVGAGVTLLGEWLKRKHELNKLEIERKDKYKLVAVEKRLEVHQQALVQWDKLSQNIFSSSDIKIPLIQNAREFWFKNCLYLEKNTRREFKEVIFLIYNYSINLEIYKQLGKNDKNSGEWKQIEKNWERIMNFPNVIFKDVELEPITFKPETDAEGKKLEGEIR